MSRQKTARTYDKLHTFIYHLLKHYDPKANMTAECKDILNHLIRDLSLRYITASVELCRYAKKVTIDFNAIETLTRIWIVTPDSILDFAHDTWTMYSQNTTIGIKKERRAGLFLPPARFKELFREYRGANQKIGEPAYIFLTAIIEAIFGLIIESAIKLVQGEKKITVTGLHVYRAINSSDFAYLYPLFRNSFIAGFGYIGDIQLINAQKRYLISKYH
uniref:Histone 2A-domain-containing protein n=1 Tax=Marseillevirus LCMAC201 TaxID=2506605 RepID=A0A481YYI5_9VIRU|nr:MAG: histone 2A-domain-containing protein [Marseillevirus LCMAC201]